MSADKANAQAIANLSQDATDLMQSACQRLHDALQLAEDDYPHNADKLRDAYGALRLITSTVGGEWHIWTDYARHRPVGNQPQEQR